MKKAGLPVVKFLRADYQGYNPSQPDNRDSFKWNDIPFTEWKSRTVTKEGFKT